MADALPINFIDVEEVRLLQNIAPCSRSPGRLLIRSLRAVPCDGRDRSAVGRHDRSPFPRPARQPGSRGLWRLDGRLVRGDHPRCPDGQASLEGEAYGGGKVRESRLSRSELLPDAHSELIQTENPNIVMSAAVQVCWEKAARCMWLSHASMSRLTDDLFTPRSRGRREVL